MYIKSIALIGCAICTSCGNKSSNNTSGTAATPSTETTSSSISEAGTCNPVAVPDAPLAAGQLTFSIPSDADPCTVKGYVVGFQTQLKAIRGEGDKFFINNMPAGSHDIVILAGSLAVGTLTGTSPDRGIRLKAERILAGVKTEKDKSVDLPALGSLSGTVKLSDQSDHAGIDIYVPGTGFLAKSNTDGEFSISGVPAGEHNLYMEKDGFHRGQIEAVTVADGTKADIGEVVLAIDTGAEGFIIIENGKSIVNSRTVALSVGASDDAVLMRISESDSFNSSPWKPLRTTTAYTFDSPGDKTLHVQFANANGLPSSTYSDQVTVDQFGENNDNFVPTFSLISSRVVPPDHTVALTGIKVPTHASKMMMALESSFAGGSWVDVAASATFTFSGTSSSCGDQKVFLKFKDSDGFETPATSLDFEVVCWETLSWPAGPGVAIGSAVWTGSRMLLWSNYPTVAGYSFDPLTGQSTTLTAPPSASLAAYSSAAWTGSKVIASGEATTSGYSYDPQADSWQAIAANGNPSQRVVTISMGAKVILVGDYNTAIYDSSLNSWTTWNPGLHPTAVYGDAGGVWTGQEVILLCSYAQAICRFGLGGTSTRTTENFPTYASVEGHTALWTGKALLALATGTGPKGTTVNYLMEYDPTANAWTSHDVPGSTVRVGSSVVWTGSAMIIWSGYAHHGNQGLPFKDGLIYHPF